MRTPSRRHVSFADGVTVLGDAALPVCSPEAEWPQLILPVVVEDSSVAPVEELIELVPSALGSSLPPPPGFSPFMFPLNDGGMDADELCARLGVDCSPSLAPISRVCTDVPDLAVSPGVGVLVSPIIDGSSDVAPAELPLLSVDNSFGQAMLWAPAEPQDTRPNDDREIPVPRWRLAREGPFLAERSPESIRSLGVGGWVRIQTYHLSCLGLRIACGGLWPTPAPPTVHRMDRGPPVGRTYRNQWCPVGRQTLTGPGRSSTT